PASVRAVLPWARQHVVRVSRRYDVSVADLWDETVTALLRVSLHHDTPEQIRRGDRYSRTAVHRACWRYVVRQAVKQPRLSDVDELGPHDVYASAEDEVMAREAMYVRGVPGPDATASAPSSSHSDDRPALPAAARARPSSAAASK